MEWLQQSSPPDRERVGRAGELLAKCFGMLLCFRSGVTARCKVDSLATHVNFLNLDGSDHA